MKARFASLAVLAAIAGCGSQRESAAPDRSLQDRKPEEAASAPSQMDARGLAIKPLPEDAPLTLKFKGTIAADRQLADSDPLGARSNFKIRRSFELTCRMIARAPQGVGPDGPTTEQKAILDAAEAENNAASADIEASSAASVMRERIEACGEDVDCQQRVALEIAQDPELRRAAEAEEARNAALSARLEAAADRATAVRLEPNWQFLAPDVSPYGDGPPACVGALTVDDVDNFRFGFDGADMGEGVKSRKGTAEPDGGGAPEIWFDLKRGRLIVDAQLGAVRAVLPAACAGACESAWNDNIALNDDWGAKAGEVTRLEKGDQTQVEGKRLFTFDILPEKHHKFSGGGEIEVEIVKR